MFPTGETAAARFTPAEGAARLAGAARAINTLAALPRRAALFVACKLAHEGGWRVRGSLCDGFQRSLFVTRPKQVASVAYEFRILTDLIVSEAKEYEDVYDWFAEVENKQVIVTTAAVVRRILEEEILGMESINILVMDCCHQVTVDSHLQTIMDIYNRTEESSQPRILSLTFPIFIQDNMRVGFSEPASDEETDETPHPETADTDAGEGSAENEEKVENHIDIPSNVEKFGETNEIIEAHLAKSLVANLECIIVKDCDREISRKVRIIELNDDEDETYGKNVDEHIEVNDIEAENLVLNSEYDEKLSLTISTLKNEETQSVQLAVLQKLGNQHKISSVINFCENHGAKENCLENGVKTMESLQKVDISNLDHEPSIEEIMEAKDCSNKEVVNSTNIHSSVVMNDEDNSENSRKADENMMEEGTVNALAIHTVESSRENDEKNVEILEKSRCESKLIRAKMDGVDIPYRIYERLECKLRRLENLLYCKADLAEDMEGIRRLTITKPRELIVEFDTEKDVIEEYRQLEGYMRTIVGDALDFLSDHRYDPTEIYGEDAFSEELRAIPDPTADPKEIFHQFLYVLDHLGPYGADKAAFSLLAKLEKLKVKIPYERHFLLLCLCMSVFLKIRSAADLVFQKYPCDYTKIKLFCKPKIMRLGHVLTQFKPYEAKDPKWRDSCSKDDKPVDGEACLERTESEKVAENVSGEVAVPEDDAKKNHAKVPENKKDDTELETKIVDQINVQSSNLKIGKIILENSSNDSVLEEKLNGDISDRIIEKTPGMEKAKSRKTSELMQQLNKCDFVSLGNRIADKVNTYACNLAEISEETPESSGNFQAKIPPVVSGNRGRSGGRSRGRGRGPRTVISGGRIQQNSGVNPDALCGVIFVQEALMAKVLFMLIVELSRSSPDLWFLCAQYSAIEKPADPITEPREAEQQRKKQEEVLKKFRMHECNLLLATSAIEEGIDLPRCNLVLRWDPPNGYRSYGLCRARARAPRSVSILLAAGDDAGGSVEDEEGRQADRTSTEKVVQNLATYFELDQMMSRASGCGTRDEVCSHEESDADALSDLVEPYRPGTGDAAVGLRGAVALVNRYCSKLPSDTFTRLAATWTAERILLPTAEGGEREAFICTLRLPINCPVKYNVVGHPMPTRALARRMVALQACRILHMAGELDDQLMPIGKETFKALEMDNNSLPAGIPPSLGSASDVLDLARPGTTKRRQYYYKRTAWSFTDCRPMLEDEPNPAGRKNLLYAISSRLCCPLPERYNTRGRRLHAPESAKQGLAILTSREIKKIPAFPVYTRSGEVRVSLQLVSRDARLSAERARLAARFMRFTFADVLRVTRHRMEFDGGGGVNDMYIVPTVKVVDPKTNAETITIDWAFLELITSHVGESNGGDSPDSGSQKRGAERILRNPLIKEGEKFEFDADLYREAVVTPWYRNQDQPQYFFVAEICNGLSPCSAFPSAAHGTFEEYYRSKYGVEVTQANQPLLDVDHTSARLNLLTPRYVNRKGVALPVSSERTRRARRDCLDQKQILLPELCRPHPFQLPLWWAAVTLPCILYRINALLIADEIRRSVAIDVGVGIPDLTKENFQWPPLHFGWRLLDVLAEEQQRGSGATPPPDPVPDTETSEAPAASEKTINDILAEKEGVDGAFEIGMWSNEMANSVVMDDGEEPLPGNLTFCTSANGGKNWGETIEKSGKGHNRTFSMADSDVSYMSSDFDTSDDSDTDLDTGSEDDNDGFCSSKKTGATMGVRIEFKTNGHEAEAIDVGPTTSQSVSCDREEEAAKDLNRAKRDFVEYFYKEREEGREIEEHVRRFRESVQGHKQDIYSKKLVIPRTKPVIDLLPNADKEIPTPTPTLYEENGPAKDKKDLDVVNTLENVSELNSLLNGLRLDSEEKSVPNLGTVAETILLPDLETIFESHLPVVTESVPAPDSTTTSDSVHTCKQTLDTKCMAYSNSECKDSFVSLPGENDTAKNLNAGADLEAKLVLNSRTEPETVSTANSEFANKDGHVRNSALIDQKPDYESTSTVNNRTLIQKLFPFTCDDANLRPYQNGGTVSLKRIEWNKRVLLQNVKRKMEEREWKNLNCFSMKDVDVDSPDYVDEKVNNVGFDGKEEYQKVLNDMEGSRDRMKVEYGGTAEWKAEVKGEGKRKKAQDFDFDYQPNLLGHPGPSPSVILQALTMSNANDGINLERLETIGDSFLKYAITAYLYCARPGVHEGKLSHMRSRQVSNHNLYRLGRSKRLGARMIASKFEPHDNWLPPCHTVPRTLAAQRSSATMSNPMEKCKLRMECLDGSGNSSGWDNAHCFIPYNLITQHSIPDKSVADCVEALIGAYLIECGPRGALLFMSWLGIKVLPKYQILLDPDHPYVKMMEEARSKDEYLDTKNVVERRIDSKRGGCKKKTMELQSIKKLAEKDGLDREAEPSIDGHNLNLSSEKTGAQRERPQSLQGSNVNTPKIGSQNLKPSGPLLSQNTRAILESEAAQKAQLGLDPSETMMEDGGTCEAEEDSSVEDEDWTWPGRLPGSLKPFRDENGQWVQEVFGELRAPPSPLLRFIHNPEEELERMLSGYSELERTLGYQFRDRSLLLQAMTHASHAHNTLTDCYQRLEFLGDAILDYLITRHLYEDKRRHSPGALTDLRSALVNNTIFATLAVRHGFHKYFRHMSPGLNEVLARYVRIQEENGHSISEEHYLIQEDELEQAEDVEVPKALGDLFESVAGAIFLDSGMSLSAVWRVYHALMSSELEAFSAAVPKSPVRELLEAEPETAKFGKPERLADGRRVRVSVEVFGRGTFRGVGRNYRIAKGTAARCALRHLAAARRRQ